MSEELLNLGSFWDIETKDGKRLATGLRSEQVNPWFDQHPVWAEFAVEVRAGARMLCIVVLVPGVADNLLEA